MALSDAHPFQIQVVLKRTGAILWVMYRTVPRAMYDFLLCERSDQVQQSHNNNNMINQQQSNYHSALFTPQPLHTHAVHGNCRNTYSHPNLSSARPVLVEKEVCFVVHAQFNHPVFIKITGNVEVE